MPDGSLRVPVSVPPTMRPSDIDMNSRYNIDWNLRTLTLLSRAGIIELDSVVPPKIERQGDVVEDNGKAAEHYRQLLHEYRNHRIIRILDQEHLYQETWPNRVENLRQKTASARDRGVDLMQEILNGKRCISEIFAEMYSIPRREEPFRRGVTVVGACGGCVHCRERGESPFANPSPRIPPPAWRPNYQVGHELARLMMGHRLMAIFYEPTDVNPRIGRDRIERVIRWLVMQGVRNMIINNEDIWNRVKKTLKNIPDAYVFRFSQYRLMNMPQIATVIFLGDREYISSSLLLRLTDSSTELPRILLIPNSGHDPLRIGVPLMDTLNEHKLGISEFITEVNP